MKRLIVLSCVAFLLLVLFACDKSKILTEPQSQQEQIERIPLSVTFSGSFKIDNVLYTSKSETTFVLPEKNWPVNKWHTNDELAKLGIKTEGLHKSASGPHWYFVLYSGGQIQIPRSCDGYIIFSTLNTTFPSYNCYTDAWIDPHTYMGLFSDSGAFHYSYITDVDSDGNTDCGYVVFDSPGSLLQNQGWNIGSSGSDGDGWTNNDGKISQLDVFYNTCNLPSGGFINISQIVFHLVAI